MTNGLYGYYDIKKQYVVYIGKDAHIDKDQRHKDHKKPSNYDEQVINRVIQNNSERYTYFRFIEGDYDTQTLNELEEDAIRIFNTYRYDYPDRNVFNFQRGGDSAEKGINHPNWRHENYKVVKTGMRGEKQLYAIYGRCGKKIKSSFNKKELEKLSNQLNRNKITEEEAQNLQLYDAKKQNHPNWRSENYKVVKLGIKGGNQQYAILGRCGKKIKYSINKKKLEELTNKLNKKEITEDEAKNLQLYNRKERAKNTRQAHIKYNMWDTSCSHYKKGVMFKDGCCSKLHKCFIYKYESYQLPIGLFHDFVTCQIIDSIVKEAVKNEK